jgi:transcriptional regulator NrdR family protein
MTRVTKRDGRTEEFMPEKIVVSAVKSGATPEAAREIAGEVERGAGESIDSEQIRARVLEGLGRRNPEWRRNWEVYDQAVKRRA